MMHGSGQSDRPVAPMKFPNKAGRPAAEGMEGRGLAKGNLGQRSTVWTQRQGAVHHELGRVRQGAFGFDVITRGGSRMR
jgi:RNA-directed DNA polymerase